MMQKTITNSSKNTHEIDMCNGPLFSKLLIFSIPLMLSGILQLLFNAADLVVVGNYSTDPNSLSAVGATSSMMNFFTNFTIGISIGANVVVARFFGANKDSEVHKSVHTSVLTGLLLGIIFGSLGFIFCKPILLLMKTPQSFLEQSVLYSRIIFVGMPASMVYNFGSSVLRAVGDTKRPLYFLTASGILNVILNLFFVIVLKRNADGVALATIISQCLSAFLVIACLIKSNASYRLSLKDLKIDTRIFLSILRVGIPAGLQSVIFSLSNMLIQSGINFFGEAAIAGNTACSNIEGFVYTAMNSIYQTNLSVSSQNYGAGNKKRMKKTLLYCLIIVTIVGLILGNLGVIFGNELIGIYKNDPACIEYGMIRMKIIMIFYCLCGIMEVLCGSLRAYGYGILPMIVSLIGACLFRVIWIYTAFQKIHTLECLYWSYPLSWILTILAHAVCLIIVMNIDKKRDFRHMQEK